MTTIYSNTLCKLLFLEDLSGGKPCLALQKRDGSVLGVSEISYSKSGNPLSKRHLEWLKALCEKAKSAILSFEVHPKADGSVKLLLPELFGLNGGGFELKEVNPRAHVEVLANGTTIYHYEPKGTVEAVNGSVDGNLSRFRHTRELAVERRVVDIQQVPACDARVAQLLQKDIWSFREYMRQALFHPTFGYYMTREKIFNTGTGAGDFVTEACRNPILGYQFATQAFAMWKAMRESKEVDPTQPFPILELGAGLGMLSDNFFRFITSDTFLASSHDAKQFAQAVTYVIGEISPQLRRKQEMQNAAWIQAKKLQVLEADACTLSKYFKAKSFKIVFSNELVDTFPTHAIRLNAKGELEALAVIPQLRHFAKHCYPATYLQLQNDGCQLLQQYQGLFGRSFKNAQGPIISCSNLSSLRKGMLEDLEWHHVYLPASYFPDLLQFVEEYKEFYFADFKPNSVRYVNTSIAPFVEGLSHVLDDRAYAITIDYGYEHLQHPDEELRTYSDVKRPSPMNEGHTGFGDQDITCSVNFSLLVESGLKRGFETAVFIPQAEFDKVMKPGHQSSYIETPPNMGGRGETWQVLIQKMRDTRAHYFLPAERGAIIPTNVAFGIARALFDFINHPDITTKDFAHFTQFCSHLYGASLFCIDDALLEHLFHAAIKQPQNNPYTGPELELIESVKKAFDELSATTTPNHQSSS